MIPMRVVAKLPKDELKPGVHIVHQGTVIIDVSKTGTVRACWNRCKHQGGKFGSIDDSILTCPHHGWKLDATTMTYENPIGAGYQEELAVSDGPNDTILLSEIVPPEPWTPKGPYRSIAPGELVVTFLAHASVEIKMGGSTVITDPWFMGPAFVRGWWLSYRPPSDAWGRLERADFIYISHSHSDHLNVPTLTELAARNSNVRFIIPPFVDCQAKLKDLGFRNVQVLDFGKWNQVNEFGKVMLLKDGKSRNDSGIIFDFKGFRILSTVDCSDLNGGRLPTDVDMLMMSYSGGAVDYPVCWGDMYSELEIGRRIRRDRRQIVNRIVDTVQRTNAKWFVGFASDFAESHPSDADIARVNQKNSPEVVMEAVQLRTKAAAWMPRPGSAYDFSTGIISDEDVSREPMSHDFEPWILPIQSSLGFAKLQRAEGLLEYFRWTGYRGDLSLDIVETDENFQSVIRQTLIDLRTPEIVVGDPDPSTHYLRIRVRADVFRYVLQHGLPWEEFAIGFQARFMRFPDIHRMDFWEHMQDRLPDTSPWVESEH